MWFFDSDSANSLMERTLAFVFVLVVDVSQAILKIGSLSVLLDKLA